MIYTLARIFTTNSRYFSFKKIVANRRLSVLVVVVALVCEVSGDGGGDGHEGEGEVDGLGAVAAVSLALAHQSVVLLEDGLGEKRSFNFKDPFTHLISCIISIPAIIFHLN